MTSTIKAVLFDADGVLQRSPPLGDRLKKAFDIDDADIDACISDMFAVEGPALIGQHDYAVALQPALEKWAPGRPASAFFDHWHTFLVDHEVIEVVRALRRAGVYCAIASNQEQHRAARMSVDLAYGEIFDAEFYSHRIGHVKPRAEYFQAVLALSGLDAAQTLFIDDIEANVAAARRVGLNAERFELPPIAGGSGAAELIGLLARWGLQAVTEGRPRAIPAGP